MLFGLRIVGDFGATIAVPAVLGALAGRWLDAKWGTHPWALVLCLVLAFSGTALIVMRKAKSYGSEYQKLIDDGSPPARG